MQGPSAAAGFAAEEGGSSWPCPDSILNNVSSLSFRSAGLTGVLPCWIEGCAFLLAVQGGCVPVLRLGEPCGPSRAACAWVPFRTPAPAASAEGCVFVLALRRACTRVADLRGVCPGWLWGFVPVLGSERYLCPVGSEGCSV